VRLAELLEAVDALLRMHGYRVEHIRYPDEHSRRSIDVVAVGEGREVLLKVVEDTRDLSSTDLRELNACSSVLDAAGIVVADSDHGEELDYMVAIEKGSSYAVSVDGLQSALRGGVYVLRRQNNYYMQVDGKKLKEKRLEKGYSLGDVANYLSVSRRSVYLYEQEGSLVSLPVALKLMELFGDEIFKPIDIMSFSQARKESKVYAPSAQTSGRAQLAHILAAYGYSVAATRRIPPDIVAGKEDEGRRDRIIMVVERRRDVVLERRVEEAKRVASQLGAEVIAVTRRRDLENNYGIEVVSDPEELSAIMRERTAQD